MFELETPTKAKVLRVDVLSQKNRQPDEDPGAKLRLEMLVSNDVLSTMDGTLKGWLYMRDANTTPAIPSQISLDGVEIISDMPNLTNAGAHIKSLPWFDELTGYHLAIDNGLGGRSDIGIDDCKLWNFKIKPKPAGVVLLQVDIESENVSDKLWGKLSKMKGRSFDVVLLAPEIKQDSLGDPKEGWPFPKDAQGNERPPQSVTHEAPPKGRKGAAREFEGKLRKADATEAFLDANDRGAPA